jgi:RNA polymerase sigma-70 factor, ECF subfamily
MTDSPPPRRPLTTMHAQRAVRGDADSLNWLMAHLTPLLIAQARYRLGAVLQRIVDPEDLVNSAWVVTLPRLGDLRERDGRITPVLLRFLSSSIVYQIKQLVAKAGRERRSFAAFDDEDYPAERPDDTRGPETQVANAELHDRVREALDELEPGDREVVILRCVEQRPADEVAELLGATRAAIYARQARAIARLRGRLPAAVFDALTAD